MQYPNFTDPQFVDANGPGGLNAAFIAVSGSVSELGSGAWATPGLIAPEAALPFTPGALNVVAVTLNPPWGIVTSGGAVVRAHGTQTGADTQTYNPSFNSLVPASGSVTAFLAATITQIQQNPVAIPGPTQGHPSFNPSFIPTVGFATDVYTVSLSAVTGGIDNINTFELFRTTLTAGQSSIAVSAISTVGWVRAGLRTAQPKTTQAGGALSVALAQSVITPTAAGVTHTLPPVSGAGGLAFTFFNPTNGSYTVSTTGADLIGGIVIGSGTASVVIPTSGSMTVWADPVGASGIWSILSASPNMLLSRPNAWLGTQTFSAVVEGTAGFVSNAPDAGNLNFRAIGGAFGAGFVNDGTNAYFASTASGSPSGATNSLRPFFWNLANGAVEIDGSGAGTTLGGSVSIDGALAVGSALTASGGITAQHGPVNATGDVIANANGSGLGRLRAAIGATGLTDTTVATLLGDFPSSFVATPGGYQKLPNGFIIQWGQIFGQSGTTVNITFPIAFPNSVFVVLATDNGNSVNPYGAQIQSNSFFSLFSTVSVPHGGQWLAIGY